MPRIVFARLLPAILLAAPCFATPQTSPSAGAPKTRAKKKRKLRAKTRVSPILQAQAVSDNDSSEWIELKDRPVQASTDFRDVQIPDAEDLAEGPSLPPPPQPPATSVPQPMFSQAPTPTPPTTTVDAVPNTALESPAAVEPATSSIPAVARKAPETDAEYAEWFCAQQPEGRVEAELSTGEQVDCLTRDYAVEVEFASNYKEAIGQVEAYAAFSGKKGGIALILSTEDDLEYLNRLQTVIKTRKLDIRVWKIRPSVQPAVKDSKLVSASI